MLQTHDDMFDKYLNEVSKGLRNGSLVRINKREILIFNVIRLSQYEKINNLDKTSKLADILHLSENTNHFEPYFMLTNQDSPE